MSTLSRDGSHSAVVEIRLEIEGEVVEVAQASETSLILCEPLEVAQPCYGVVSVTVDGEEFRRDVFFYEGISKSSLRASYRLEAEKA